jgi:hypothetical protein
MLVLPAASFAQGFFLPTEDFRLREDLALLVDEDVIRIPMNTWPLPANDVREAIRTLKIDDIREPALRAAFVRVSARVAVRDEEAQWRLQEVRVTAGKPGLLRVDDTLGREKGELRSMGGATNDRWSVTIAATGVLNPVDGKSWQLDGSGLSATQNPNGYYAGKHWRADGSELSVRWGNWLFSANQLDRWWGPGHGGGLILSSNAQPMPGVSLDRIESRPFSWPIFRWLGPWRVSAFLGAMEGSRPDEDHPKFAGFRMAFKPASIFEFGLSRTAQFCGGNRPCDLQAFRRMLLGRDNAGIDVAPEDVAANQMGGFDGRLVSPFKSLPVALYAEMIGEDSSKGGFPGKYLALFGSEAWWYTESGTAWRARVEYANASCKWYASGKMPGCAYRETFYWAGYRYYGRNVGHTTDSDSRTTMLQLTATTAEGERWGARVRHGILNANGVLDIYNPLTFGTSDYDSLDLSWDGHRFWGQDIGLQLGYERQKGAYLDRSGAFGFIQWRKSL